MELTDVEPLSLTEVFFPLVSLGVLFAGVVAFGFLATHKREVRAYWSVLIVTAVSLLSIVGDIGALVAGGLHHRIGLALQFSRLQEVAVALLLGAVPSVVWSVLPKHSRYGRFALTVTIAGSSAALLIVFFAFAKPELFSSVTRQLQNSGAVIYSSDVGRGAHGVLMRVRDVLLAAVFVASLIIGLAAGYHRVITGPDRLIVAGITIGVLVGAGALYANVTGSYLGVFAELRFSRVGAAQTLFALLAIGAYVGRFLRQSRRLDETNHELVHRRDRLAFLAYHNESTQMPNRQALVRDVEELLADVRDLELPHDDILGEAIICDLDSFSSIEDSYGLTFSEALLRTMGHRLEALVTEMTGDTGTVYHIDGNRFACLLRGSVEPDTRLALEHAMIHEISAPATITDQEVFLSAALGQYTIRADAADSDEVLRRLKRALAAASERRSNVGRYSPETHLGMEENQRLVQQLRKAIRAEDFSIHYQPIVHSDGAPMQCEALLRWEGVNTERFVALAEKSGLIVPLTEFVIRSAARDLARMHRTLPDISVHVNIPAHHIEQLGFPGILTHYASQHGLSPHHIGVEITETSVLRGGTTVADILTELTSQGFDVAIDDFGTGYSSMSYLKEFPARRLKIDRSFVNGLPGQSDDRALVHSMITLAHELRKEVVVEGVETREQRDYLLGEGADYLQGYYFSRPMPLSHFLASFSVPNR
ncbi:MAG: putative bifunctional diguanylate cyclase/phosphodiesterase [Spirochaetota bacterium]